MTTRDKIPKNKKQKPGPSSPKSQGKADVSDRQKKAGADARQEAAEKGSDRAEPGQGDRPDREQKAAKAPVTVVGIGASAGGLKALEGFLNHLTTDTGMAFVIVQHLDPHRVSHLESLLKNHTSVTVRTVEEDTRVRPDTVYLSPPGKNIFLQGGMLQLLDIDEEERIRHPIDVFFQSLARQRGESAVAVVLSGAGSDGTAGIREVNAAGGLTIAQEEEEASYSSMPRSAIETGQIDMVLPVGKMGEEIVRYQEHSDGLRSEVKEHLSEKRLGRDILMVLSSVRSATGHDFSSYKRKTVRRRIERRMAVHHLEKISDYAHLTREHPEEAQALFKDLLINVTSFFRDPEAFDLLSGELGRLLEDHPSDAPLRAWVPGCATGEEAYSLGMLLIESMDRLNRTIPVKIFATDINPESIAIAREGSYAENLLSDISEKRLQRFFLPQGKHYRIGAHLREMVVFAVHDLTRDPPFSRLDIVSCRNLLIYMDRSLQRRVLPLLHYGLNPGGLLLLGSSEEVGEASELFAPVNRKWKIFRAREHPNGQGILYPEIPISKSERRGAEGAKGTAQDRQEPGCRPHKTPARKGRGLRDLVESTIMTDYAPPGIVINEANEIIYFQGDTNLFLAPPQGEPRFDLMRMVRGELADLLPDLLHRTRKQKGRLTREAKIPNGAGTVPAQLSVKPLAGAAPGTLQLTFELREKAREDGGEVSDTRAVFLQRELHSTRQELQATIEELESANEELQSANEELQANNEELQSTNEELETSREELQSTNEELETVNTELQKKNEQLIEANNDIKNLFGATDICTLILDRDLRIQRFTPSATRCFRLIESDIGRPLTDIATPLALDDLETYLDEVLETLEKQTHEVTTRDGEWYSLHLLPYRTSENAIAGVVVTLSDVTELKKMQVEATEARTYSEAILDTIREPLLVLTGDLKVVSANHAFYRDFRTAPETTENRPLFELGNGQWDIPELRRLLTDIIPENTHFEDYRIRHDFPDLGRRAMLLNARRIDLSDRPNLVLLAIEDITGTPHAEEGT